MLLNQNVAVSTSKVLLVPYAVHHVLTYHEWMKNPSLQNATASEPLTLKEEYEMQQKWRQDADKLTFIICLPDDSRRDVRDGRLDSQTMIGDVNLFICFEEHENSTLQMSGELELMIAHAQQQRKGYGRSAILSMLRYVLEHETGILQAFQKLKELKIPAGTFSRFAVKIGASNPRSIALFESLGFVKTNTKPNYFEEFELRHEKLTLEVILSLMAQYDIQGYKELTYISEP